MIPVPNHITCVVHIWHSEDWSDSDGESTHESSLGRVTGTKSHRIIVFDAHTEPWEFELGISVAGAQARMKWTADGASTCRAKVAGGERVGRVLAYLVVRDSLSVKVIEEYGCKSTQTCGV